jgi:hypothetical protein
VTSATVTHAKIDELLEEVFSVGSVQRRYMDRDRHFADSVQLALASDSEWLQVEARSDLESMATSYGHETVSSL